MLFRGIGVVASGAGPAHAIYFACYEFTKNILSGGGRSSVLAQGNSTTSFLLVLLLLIKKKRGPKKQQQDVTSFVLVYMQEGQVPFLVFFTTAS